MIAEVTKLIIGNRVVIPASIRKSLGLQVGDAITTVLHNSGEVRMPRLDGISLNPSGRIWRRSNATA